MLLQGKNAVIYGAGGAVGAAVARKFASEGARVFLTGRRLDQVQAVAKEIAASGLEAEAAAVDALVPEQVEAHLDDVIGRAGGVDISFNAISIPYLQGDPLTAFSVAEFAGALTDGLTTQFITATAAGRRMAERNGGVILAITATPARDPRPGTGNFGVACAGIEGLCRQLAADLGPSGVRVVCLRSAGSPDAPVVSRVFDFMAEQAGVTRAEFEAGLADSTQLKRLPLLVEVAGAAALMASDYASAITGTVANVTCGQILD
jgi:NAD(P)-dependent dehydrogenase (short-subunit alcohol dehydrogenase family)